MDSKPLLVSLKKFISSKIVILILIGGILILVGNIDIVRELYQWYDPASLFKTPPFILGSLRSVGGALLGSGVFTAIIKSTEFTEVFENVIEKIIWDESYITSRPDKDVLWKMLSNSLYTEKFKGISDDLQKLVIEHYFPINHHYYVNKIDYTVNIIDIDINYARHEETLNIIFKPCNTLPFEYKGNATIDLPPIDIEDKTVSVIDEITINGKQVEINNLPGIKDGNVVKFPYSLTLADELEYDVKIKRHKVLYKQTNIDKRLFFTTFTRNVTITIIVPENVNVSFYRMGTINEFEEGKNLINGQTRLLSWHYSGIIMPHQGCIILTK